jgi:hypothetical protein
MAICLKDYIDEYFDRYKSAENNYLKAHEIGIQKQHFKIKRFIFK